MDKKLYVGNINFKTTEDDLKELFSQHGTVVSAKIITDKFSGRSKGFGFVEMSSAEEAQKAMAALKGTEFGGRPLNVDLAREPREGGSGMGGGMGGGMNRDRAPRRGGFGGRDR